MHYRMNTRLSVNINKVALIRNSRPGNYPDVIRYALDCEDFGAQGITVHPRPDQRHIRYADIPLLRQALRTELNVEGYPSPDFMELVLRNPPEQVTLVPDAPDVLTSDHGWDIPEHIDFLVNTIGQLKAAGIRVSLFIDPDPAMIEPACSVGADCIELYTGQYAKDYAYDRESAVGNHLLACKLAVNQGLRVHAGHDLNLENLGYYIHRLQNISEVSIGHALTVDALYVGLANSIEMYKAKLVSKL